MAEQLITPSVYSIEHHDGAGWYVKRGDRYVGTAQGHRHKQLAIIEANRMTRRALRLERRLTGHQRRVINSPTVVFLGYDQRWRPVVHQPANRATSGGTWALTRSGDPTDVSGEVE